MPMGPACKLYPCGQTLTQLCSRLLFCSLSESGVVMKMNVMKHVAPVFTHEGAKAANISPEKQLRRTVMACLLWEETFYEGGQSVADRIKALIPKIKAQTVADIAIEARTKQKLRHVPLLIVREMARLEAYKGLVAETLAKVIMRADEPAEFLAMYWADNDGKKTLSKQVKKGLAAAILKFDEYQLAKYNRDSAVKLRDVVFLTHAKPADSGQSNLFARLVNKETIPKATKGGNTIHLGEEKIPNEGLKTPDTWEVALSGGADKKATFERLMAEEKLFGLAFIRNLRNMQQAGCDKALVDAYARKVNIGWVLPFRFISAANAVPQWEPIIEEMMLRCLESGEKLKGKTVLLLDVSGSMVGAKVSAKSDIDRADAAIALGILLREICEDPVIVAFSTTATVVPPRRGFALRDAVRRVPGYNGGTDTGSALRMANTLNYHRVIVMTDEQSHTSIPDPLPNTHAYFVNVATNKNGIGYGKWTHIDGWSESIIEFIRQAEKVQD